MDDQNRAIRHLVEVIEVVRWSELLSVADMLETTPSSVLFRLWKEGIQIDWSA